ncbi:hypothetical protein HWQ46_26420 [Shewanella sp. D64]|uniref:hypothetical protein n=1 Tax=unclassified Shewanella TaxID=196818 RepID=UPI0022BA3BFE|nr:MULTISPECIES: hypothetical protein [unclassified Shewanella]MEC4729052.1 hypothetical protein [Shewanella sp. D64]MEC4737889.1 hypothetical protein [Shewanella sp. E94]WBJ93858.1 hypothetical protein HWQ47_18255 [Shewanella sp. MTB7]
MKALVWLLLLFFISTSVFAYKECAAKTSRLYIGDNGSLWMVFESGGVANIRSNDVDFDRTYSMLLAAQMADKQVVIRYQDDSAQCGTGIRSDIVGVWLIK